MPEVRLIDANAAADKIMRETENRAEDLNIIGIALMIGIARMLRDENDFPTIEAEPVRHGRWESIGGDEPENQGVCCSECDYTTACRTCFCPHCGACMDGGADNDT